jgi:ribosomal protein S18 acetylase RimI-like enzyme
LISGKIADNDTGFDIDDIDAAYMKPPGNHFWVAEAPPVSATPGTQSPDADPATGMVVGMIGVQHYDDGAAEIRRLRVARTHRRRGIGSALVERALTFCQEHQYLKITLDTFMEREPAIKLFQKFRFRHSRTRSVGDKQLMYFYLDLYTGEAKAE